MTNAIFRELEFQGFETIQEKHEIKLIGEVNVEKTYRFGYLIKEKKVLVGNLVQGHYENKSVPISFNIYNERLDELEEESERISSEIGELHGHVSILDNGGIFGIYQVAKGLG